MCQWSSGKSWTNCCRGPQPWKSSSLQSKPTALASQRECSEGKIQSLSFSAIFCTALSSDKWVAEAPIMATLPYPQIGLTKGLKAIARPLTPLMQYSAPILCRNQLDIFSFIELQYDQSRIIKSSNYQLLQWKMSPLIKGDDNQHHVSMICKSEWHLAGSRLMLHTLPQEKTRFKSAII